MVYGNFTTITFDDVNVEELLVANLKRKIFMRVRVEPQN
jgi:hypothetical protein